MESRATVYARDGRLSAVGRNGTLMSAATGMAGKSPMNDYILYDSVSAECPEKASMWRQKAQQWEKGGQRCSEAGMWCWSHNAINFLKIIEWCPYNGLQSGVFLFVCYLSTFMRVQLTYCQIRLRCLNTHGLRDRRQGSG